MRNAISTFTKNTQSINEIDYFTYLLPTQTINMRKSKLSNREKYNKIVVPA